MRVSAWGLDTNSSRGRETVVRKIAEFLTSVLQSLRIVSYKYNTYTPTMLLTVAHMEIKLGTHM